MTRPAVTVRRNAGTGRWLWWCQRCKHHGGADRHHLALTAAAHHANVWHTQPRRAVRDRQEVAA